MSSSLLNLEVNVETAARLLHKSLEDIRFLVRSGILSGASALIETEEPCIRMESIIDYENRHGSR